MSRNLLDFDRIKHLLNTEVLAAKHITIVGLGSGGAPVLRHLVMSGVHDIDLYDQDLLELTKKPLNKPSE